MKVVERRDAVFRDTVGDGECEFAAYPANCPCAGSDYDRPYAIRHGIAGEN